MARLIVEAYASPTAELSTQDRRRAHRRIARQRARNPLRRILLACEVASQRDATAAVGDLVWCEEHADFAGVISVVE